MALCLVKAGVLTWWWEKLQSPGQIKWRCIFSLDLPFFNALASLFDPALFIASLLWLMQLTSAWLHLNNNDQYSRFLKHTVPSKRVHFKFWGVFVSVNREQSEFYVESTQKLHHPEAGGNIYGFIYVYLTEKSINLSFILSFNSAAFLL